MVDFVRVDAKKIDLEASNQILYGLKVYLLRTTTVQWCMSFTEKMVVANICAKAMHSIKVTQVI